jgi:hypothetical protein
MHLIHRPTAANELLRARWAAQQSDARVPSIFKHQAESERRQTGRATRPGPAAIARARRFASAVETGNVDAVGDPLRLRVERGIAMQHEGIVPRHHVAR